MNEAAPVIIAQSWPWGSQIVVKKTVEIQGWPLAKIVDDIDLEYKTKFWLVIFLSKLVKHYLYMSLGKLGYENHFFCESENKNYIFWNKNTV